MSRAKQESAERSIPPRRDTILLSRGWLTQQADSRLGFGVQTEPTNLAEVSEIGHLSPRVLALSRSRLQRLAAILLGLTLVYNLVLQGLYAELRAPPAPFQMACLLSMAIVLDGAMMAFAGSSRLDDERISSLGLGYYVLRSLVLALYSVRLQTLIGGEPSPVTAANLSIAFFPLLVPTPPRQLLGSSALAGITSPLALWIGGASRGTLIQGGYYALVSVALAVFCGQLALGLTAAVSRLRELGPYRLIETLSRRSTGTLWTAEHRLLRRSAAVKVIRSPWLFQRRFRRHLDRFEREARVAIRLTSPHSVTVYDYGVTDDGSFYYARELLDGETLLERVERTGPCSPLTTLTIALQVCDSLAEAHEAGLVHRRLSPRQIFLCRIGRRTDFVKVLDFGLVDFQQRIRLGKRSAYEVLGPWLEAFDYPAPETLAHGIVDERTDLYQLGCVLHFLLSGKRGPPPHAAFARPGETDREDTSEATQTVRARLEYIALRCTAPDPADRYRSADELAAALGHVLRVYAWEELMHAHAPAATIAPLPPRRTRAASTYDPFRPGELPSVERHRLERFGWLMAALTIVGVLLTMLAADLPLAELRPSGVTVFFLLLALDATMILVARARRLGARTAMHVAAGYFALRIALTSPAVLLMAEVLGTPPAPISFALLFLFLLPLLVPLKPAWMLLLAGAAASVHPVVLSLTPGVQPAIVRDAIVSALIIVLASYICARFVVGVRQPFLGRTIGAYRLTQLLGRGAMGEVWRAEHELLARSAAVKLISATWSTARSRLLRARFAREAQVTACLTSPHTVTLYDYGVTEDGTYYYVMELLDGQNLQQLVERRGPLPWQLVVRIALQACDSLIEAHATGLVHRDLKPANLFLARIGRSKTFLKVRDFGLAELERHLRIERSRDGQVPLVVGTPGYLPPEMLLEQEVDARADIYQLGCVLFFLLTGRLVFEGSSTPALAVAHVREKPPTMSSVSQAPIPDALERIVAKCLRKSPAERFDSAVELEGSLRRLLPHIDSSPDLGLVAPSLFPLVQGAAR